MGWFICPDYCLDNYVSPPVAIPDLDDYDGLGDPLDIAVGSAKHGTEKQGICNPGEPVDEAGEVVHDVQLSGTNGEGGRAYTAQREFQALAGGGVRIKTSFQHPHGPFGNLTLPVKAAHWCRPWGGAPISKEFYHTPAMGYPQFSPTYQRFHLIIPIKSTNKRWDLHDPQDWNKELYFKFDITTSADLDGVTKRKKVAGAGAALNALRFSYPGNITPHVPSTGAVNNASGGISNFLKWRKVMSPSLDIELAMWLPVRVVTIAGTEVKNDDLFFNQPRLIIDIKKFQMIYM